MAFAGISLKTGAVEATDGQLFALMAQRGEEAKQAWEIFYHRYATDLYHSVIRLRGIQSHDAENLVQETMILAWRKANTFKADDPIGEEDRRNRTLAWLGRIAQRIVYQKHRSEKIALVLAEKDANELSPEKTGRTVVPPGEINRAINTVENELAKFDLSEADDESPLMRRLVEALGTLTERELDVLLTSYDYYDAQESARHLPDPIIKTLCQRHGITSTNLRQIKKRADDKLRKYLCS